MQSYPPPPNGSARVPPPPPHPTYAADVVPPPPPSLGVVSPLPVEVNSQELPPLPRGREAEGVALVGRLPNGRFGPGNPGKPRGARSRISVEIEKLLEEAAPDAVRTIHGAAKFADVAAAKWILDRVAPHRQGRTVILEDFPAVKEPGDIGPALAAIAASFADGTISLDEATAAVSLMQKFLATLEAAHRLGSGSLRMEQADTVSMPRNDP